MATPLPKRPYRKARVAVKRIVTSLQAKLCRETNIVASEIIEGGSLGHGTAVPIKFDIDLVLCSRSILPEQLCNDKQRRELLQKVQDCLKKHLKGNYEFEGYTPFAIQFKYKFSPGHYIEVDLLLSTYCDSPAQVTELISKHCPDNPYKLSACASKWQTEFMRTQNPRIKEYVKRAKYWRNNIQWPEGKHGRPSSYLLSLLVVKAYEKVGIQLKKNSNPSRKRTAARNVTKALQELVKNHRQIDILFDSKYQFAVSPPHPPRVIDPGNICNNLYKTGIGKAQHDDDPQHYWDIFAENIDLLDLSITFQRVGFFGSRALSLPNLFTAQNLYFMN